MNGVDWASVNSMPFDIRVHEMMNIVEVVYPERPSAGDIVDYEQRIRAIIDARPPGWCCLVDQRKLALQVVQPEQVGMLAELNAYAERNGMARAARVVGSLMAELQAARISREANLKAPLRTFLSREDALSWLLSPPAPTTP